NHATTQYRNVSSIDNYGLNAGYDGSLGEGQFHYAVNVTGAVARRQEPDLPGTPLTVAPQFFGNARVSYALPGRLPTLALAAHSWGNAPTDRASASTPPAFAPPELDLRATLAGPVPSMKGLSYRLSANYAFASGGPYVIGPSQGIDLSANTGAA